VEIFVKKPNTLWNKPVGYAKVLPGARYSGVSCNTFRSWLRAGLPHFRLPSGIILVAYQDIDDWVSRFRVEGNDKKGSATTR
jgi:hypothetical protein